MVDLIALNLRLYFLTITGEFTLHSRAYRVVAYFGLLLTFLLLGNFSKLEISSGFSLNLKFSHHFAPFFFFMKNRRLGWFF